MLQSPESATTHIDLAHHGQTHNLATVPPSPQQLIKTLTHQSQERTCRRISALLPEFRTPVPDWEREESREAAGKVFSLACCVVR